MFHFIKRIRTRLKYGVSCCKSYSLFRYWAEQLRREIAGYKEIAGRTIALDYENFGNDIDKILEALDLIIADEYGVEDWDEREKKIEEGLQLFAKDFRRFWW